MIVIETKVKGYTIRLSEELNNYNIFGRSIYNLRIDHEDGGIYIIGIGDDMEEALQYHASYVKLAMKDEKVF